MKRHSQKILFAFEKPTVTVSAFLLQGAKGEMGSDGATVSQCEPDNSLVFASQKKSPSFPSFSTSTSSKALSFLL